MHFKRLTLMLVLARFCSGIEFPMAKWQGYDGNEKPWNAEPTWYAEYRLASILKDVPVDAVQPGHVVQVAALLFRALEQQEPNFDITSNGGLYTIVAVLWDPEHQMFWASTIPRGAQKQEMLKEGPQVAPAWYNQIRRLVSPPNAHGKREAFLHAEDGAYYNWETRTKRSRITNGRYPAELAIAAWGRARGERDHQYELCHGSKRTPNCRTVADQLGVQVVPPQPHRRALDTPDANELHEHLARLSVNPDVTAAEDLISACGVSKYKRHMHLANDSEDCSSLLLPPAMSASPLPEATIAQLVGLTVAAPMPTSAPPHRPPHCTLQQEDPDGDINTRYCVCESSVTLPLLPLVTTAEVTDACHYTTLPKAHATITTGFHSITTNTALCEVCSQVVNNEDSCKTIADCTPQAAKASVTVATSPLHVGTLTGEALYTSVSSALEQICPPVTQTTSATKCSGTAIIKDITYIEEGSRANDGELEVFAAFSSYNVTSLRNAMIESLAHSAAKSATGRNCYNETYTVLYKRQEPPIRGRKRLDLKDLTIRDHPEPEEEHIHLCNMAELAEVNYYSPLWRLAPEPGATDFIEAQYRFKITKGSFECDFLELLADALVPVLPEFAIGEIELGEAITAICQHME